MNYARLEDYAPAADALGRTMLGVTTTITMAGRTYSLQTHGNFEDGTINAGTSMAVRQEIEMMVLKTDLPAKPDAATRIRVAARPGDLFKPANVQNDDTGRHWLFNLMQVSV